MFQPAWPALFQIAAKTNTITLGPAAVNPFTSHPINIAGNLAVLDELSRGRAYLGIARGAWLNTFGIEPSKPITALKESIQLINHLLTKNKESLVGEYFSFKGGQTLKWNIFRQQIPILLGAWGLQTIRSCFNLVTEIKLGGSANPDLIGYYSKKIALISSSRNSPKKNITIGAVCVVDQNRDKAKFLAKKEVAMYLPIIAELDPTLIKYKDNIIKIKNAVNNQDFELASDFINDNLLSKFAFAGTPEDVISQTINLLKAGAYCVEFGTPHGTTTNQGVKLLGEEVLPKVKDFINK